MIRELKKTLTHTIDDISVVDDLILINNKTGKIYHIPEDYMFLVQSLVKANDKYFALCRFNTVLILEKNEDKADYVVTHKKLCEEPGTLTDCIWDKANKQYILAGGNSLILYLSEDFSSVKKDPTFENAGSLGYSLRRVQLTPENKLFVNDDYAAFEIDRTTNTFKHNWEESKLLKPHSYKVIEEKLFPQLYFIKIRGIEIRLVGNVVSDTYVSSDKVPTDTSAEKISEAKTKLKAQLTSALVDAKNLIKTTEEKLDLILKT